jgi:Putative glycosyl/glycerophosphate transferases involved in teichoic acid biosynthesis TagF/TagB/EpsJ/RodC
MSDIKSEMISKAKNIAHKVVDRPRNRFLDATSAAKLGLMIREHRNNRINTEYDRKIRVAYIVQMPQVWDKQKRLFDKLTADKRFKVGVIIVPPFNPDTKEFGDPEENIKFYKSNCKGCKFLNALDEEGKAVNIRKYRFDYVFYERPYDPYLPKTLRCKYVSAFAKTCHIPYATIDLKLETGYKTECKEFFRYLYIAFNNAERHTEIMYDSMWKPCRLPHHYLDYGYPVNYDCIEAAEAGMPSNSEESEIADRNDKKTVIMWTPRWSYEPRIGGSHFMEYKDEIISIGEEFPNTEVIIRPHPLTYDHMIATGRMTQEDVDAYLKAVEDKGVIVDSNKMINETFKGVDILISDLSSVMWQFFFSGRPIIYCPSDIIESEQFSEMSTLTYKAESYDDIRKVLSELLSGNDYMKADRMKFIEEYKNKYSDPTVKMISFLISDFSGGAVKE